LIPDVSDASEIWNHCASFWCNSLQNQRKFNASIMASVKITLDRRAKKKDGTYPIKYTISHAGRTAQIPAYISIENGQWDSVRCKVVLRDDKYLLNARLGQGLAEIGRAILQLRMEGRLKGCSAKDVRDMVLAILQPDTDKPVMFLDWYRSFAMRHQNIRTRDIYLATIVQMERFDEAVGKKTFEGINRQWLEGFFAHMAETSPSINARNIHLRNIRAAFNAAIDDGVTAAYPFRRFKIHPQPTRKRNLKPNALRSVFNAAVPDWQQKYIDVFKLMFFLIGINPADLLTLPADADDGGRIDYTRRKTHRLYSIKVEPEAKAIIDRYRGSKNLLNVADGCTNYRSFALRLNKNLSDIMPGLTAYWARHSWATIAASLDIPEDTIALALGHSSAHTTTAIYIQRDLRKVDAANRRVIDFVLNKKPDAQ
jgi:integrase